jgi:hypothetical protein
VRFGRVKSGRLYQARLFIEGLTSMPV